jgi:hypothetical protein
MKTILITAVAAGLMSLAGCTGATNETAQDNAAETNEASADIYQSRADDAANAIVANQTEAADAAEASAGNAIEATENAH